MLADYYAPIFVQQRVNSQALKHPYPPEYDMIGQAHLRHDDKGKLKAYVAGSPRSTPSSSSRPSTGHPHVQITYTAWYPAHPRMKNFDVEEADIDSCVVRVTLDADNAPLFYETIAACGCFHKVFVEKHIEDAARQTLRRAGEGQEILRGQDAQGRHRLGGGRHRGRAARRSRAGRWCSSRPANTRSSAWAAPPACACRRRRRRTPTTWFPTRTCTAWPWTAAGSRRRSSTWATAARSTAPSARRSVS